MTLRLQRVSPPWLALLVPVLLLHARAASGAEPPAPDANRKTVAITTSLVTPFFDAYYLALEARAANHLALVFNASYLLLENQEWKARTATVGAGADYYFGDDALRGWYVEAIGELWLSSWRHEPSAERAPLVLGYAGIALAGYQFVFDAGPVLDLGAGVVAFHAPSARVGLDGGAVASDALTRVYPAAKLEVGWAF
jgi:hypothetical protein